MAAQSELSVLITGKDELSPQFNQIESRLIRFVGAITSALAAIKIAALPVSSAADFERELANVKKTTEFTKTQIDALGKGILDLSLHSDQSALSLTKIASAAGQQGLGREGVGGILAFTDSVARMASVLDISAEQASSDIGKILNVFQLATTDAEKVVSAFNKASNNAPAKGRELLDIVKRIGDAAEVAGIKTGSLTNSIALAATGLEMGVSPEVIGTSFVKILGQFQTKAEKFAAFMKMSTREWSDLVAKDGVKALQLFNQQLRLTERSPQAKTISELSGQGRVYGLQNKLTRDTLDATLSKNLGNAQTGFEEGLSAIKEQRTVMNTLNAQLAVLRNSFFKLAAEGGSPLLRTLTDQVATLSAALQQPKVQAFVQSAVASLGSLLTLVFNVGAAVGTANVNWENFLKVLQLFVAVKAGQLFAGLLAQLPLVSAGYAMVATSARAAALASIEAGLAQQRAALAATIAGGGGTPAVLKQFAANKLLTEQIVAQRLATEKAAAVAKLAAESNVGTLASTKKAYADLGTTRAAVAAAAVKAAAAEAAANAAATRQIAAQQTQRAANALVGSTGAAVVTNAAKNVAAVANVPVVQAAGAAAVAAARTAAPASIAVATAAANAKILAEEQRHSARMLVIQQQYGNSRQISVIAQGHAKRVIEDGLHATSLASLRTSNAAAIAEAERKALATVAIAQQEATRLNALAASRVAGTGAAAALLASQAAAAAAAAAAATAGLAGAAVLTGAALRQSRLAAVELGRARQAAELATASFFSFGRAVAFLGTVFRFVIGTLVPVLLVLTILYSVLDSMRLLDGLPGFFRKLTDAIGLSSEAARREAQEQKDAAAALRTKQEAVQELTDAYRELLDASGKIAPVDLQNQLASLKGATDLKTRQKKTKDAFGQAAASLTIQEEASTDVAGLPAAKVQAQAEYDRLRKLVADATKDLKAKTDARKAGVGDLLDGTVGVQLDADIDRISVKLADLKVAFDRAAKARAALAGPVAETGLGRRKDNGDNNLALEQEKIGRLITEQSSALARNVDVGVLAQRRAIDELAKLEKEKIDIQKDITTTPLQKKAKDDALVPLLTAARAKVDAVRDGFEKLAKEMLAVKGIADNMFVGLSIKFLDLLIKNPSDKATDDAKDTIRVLESIEKRNAAAAKSPGTVRPVKLLGDSTGETKPAPPSTGDGAGLAGKDAANEAKKLAKAKFELEKQEALAAMNLQKQENDNLLAEDQRRFNRGLIDLKKFYVEKERVDTQNANDEIAKFDKEIKGKKQERSDPAFTPADRKRFDADLVALEGQKKVLQEKLKDIPQAAQDALALASKTFNEGVLTDQLDIGKVLGFDDFDKQLDAQFALTQGQLKFKLASLESAFRDGVKGIDRAFINNFKLTGLVKSIEPVLQSIADKAAIAAKAVQNSFEKITFKQSRGLITDRDAERATNDLNQIAAGDTRDEIERINAARDSLIAKARAQAGATDAEKDAAEATIRASGLYKKQENDLDALKQKFEELGTAIDEVASTINKGLATSLSKGISGIMSGPTEEDRKKILDAQIRLQNASSGKAKEAAQRNLNRVKAETSLLRKVFRDLADDIGKVINDIVAKDLAQSFVNNFLGSEGTGGIGGFFSKLLNPNGVGGDKPLADKGSLGRSKGTPMYVEVVNDPGKPEEAPKDRPPLVQPASERGTANDGAFGPTQDGGNLADPFGPTQDGGNLTDTIRAKGDEAIAAAGDASTSIIDAAAAVFEGGAQGGIQGIMKAGFALLKKGLLDGLNSAFSDSGGGGIGGFFASIFGGGGGDYAAAVASSGIFHTGGVVGEGSVKRNVPASVFAGAIRYHSGGIAGLQPNEVPSILQKGEEVLTRKDVRHRDNGGGVQRAPQVNITVNTPDANSFRKSKDQIAADYGQGISRASRRNT